MRNLCLTSFLLIALSSLSLHAQGTWSALGIGFNGSCRALTSDKNGTIYAGGAFTHAITSFGDAKQVNYVARWNGSEWLPLGKGSSAEVRVVLPDDEGRYLYVGGFFEQVMNKDGSTVEVNGIARWDIENERWEALGEGLDGYCSSLLLDPDNGLLYAGGSFSKAGTVNAANIATWDGSQWRALGLGLDGYCTALAMDGEGNVYMGGRFKNAGGISAVGVAKWDGSVWSPLGSGIDGLYEICFAMAMDREDNLYVGGIFTNAGNVESRNIAMWDGNSWYALGKGLNGIVRSLALDGSNHLYVAGEFNSIWGTSIRMPFVSYWNGNWNTMDEGVDTIAYAVLVAPDGSICVGGGFSIAGNIEARNIARWTPAWVGTETLRSPKNKILLYPQPADDFLHIDLQEAFRPDDVLTLSVIAADGRLLSTRQFSGTTIYSLPIADLPGGLYLLQLQSGKRQITRVFIRR